ncbi:MAG: STAS domain-containing protein [Actinomycetota bacterium]
MVELGIDITTDRGWQVIAVNGDLDLYTSPSLRTKLHEVDGDKIALDLTDVTFIDSSGLGAIVGALKHVRERGGAFAVIAQPDGSLTRLLSLTGLDQIVSPLGRREDLA